MRDAAFRSSVLLLFFFSLSLMSVKQFEGTGILAFYANGLCQGHLIKDNNESPYRLAGQLLPNYKDPNHNDCMDPLDVYKVLIQSDNQEEKGIELMLSREKNNDASGLFSVDDDISFSFTTNQFISGGKASALQRKYFKNTMNQYNDSVICIGPISFNIVISS